MADANMIVRVDPGLKQNFEWACNVSDSTASQVLRKYMRDFISEQMTQQASQIVIEESSDDDGAQFLYNKDDAAEVLACSFAR